MDGLVHVLREVVYLHVQVLRMKERWMGSETFDSIEINIRSPVDGLVLLPNRMGLVTIQSQHNECERRQSIALSQSDLGASLCLRMSWLSTAICRVTE